VSQGKITVIVSTDIISYRIFLLICALLHSVTQNCKTLELVEVKRVGGDERYTLTTNLVVKRAERRSLGKPNRR
jgi:hypothetical protein